MSELLTILQGDALEKLRELPDESVHCCVTSPPYWGLRDYGTAAWEGGDSTCDHKSGRFERGGLSSKQASNNGSGGDEARGECPRCGARRIDSQLGLEKTPEEYVAKMVEVFREVRRVLRKDGTLWLNLGDSYAGSGKGPSGNIQGEASCGVRIGSINGESGHTSGVKPPPGLKSKDLVGIPWRVAFALQADGWWLRSDIIWAKPNPMPESVTDRPTKSHEYLFLLTKSASYFYDAEAIREQVKDSQDGSIRARARTANGALGGENQHNIEERFYDRICGANKRSVWTIATQPYPEAHFATFPEELPKLCILAGTSAKGCCAKCGAPWERIVERGEPDLEHQRACGGDSNGEYFGQSQKDYDSAKAQNASATKARILAGMTKDKTLGWQPTCECNDMPQCKNLNATDPCTVLDPFAGSGTTGMVAIELGRKAILIELNPTYVKLINQRCDVTPGLQLC